MAVTKKFFVLVQCLLMFSLNYTVILNKIDTKPIPYVEFLNDAEKLLVSLDKVLDFVNRYFYEMNIDGVLGIILAEAQLLQTLENTNNKDIAEVLLILIEKCQISKKIIRLLPKASQKNILFIRFFLNPQLWTKDVAFVQDQLYDLGIYEFWTVQDILKNRTAEYRGVSSDECLSDILEETPNDLHSHLCSVSSRCQMLMFGKRNDTGYVLTHRLLYLDILELVRCAINQDMVIKMKKKYCSLILKEAKTNAWLGFPQHDIFLEQVILCGMEGFTEFLQKDWTTSIMRWQTVEGCYKENGTYVFKDNHTIIKGRSANVITFGCTDHATGLGAAALALNLRYILGNYGRSSF